LLILIYDILHLTFFEKGDIYLKSLLLLVVKVAGEFLFLFGLLAWGYGVLIQLIHPEWLPLTLSHLIQWIRVDTFTILSFAASAGGFLIWRLASALSKRQE
jgi:hypothetical protein